MKLQNTPPPDYAFGYKEQPQSGNEINGLGQAEKTQARHVFHNATGEPLPWDALDTFFSYINHWGVVRHMLGNVWLLRRQDGPVSKKRMQVDDPSRMAEAIKAEAKRRGAGIVGITEITPDMLYEGYEVPFKYAISIGLPMKRDEMVKVPHGSAAVEVMRAYKEVSRIAIEMGEYIRKLGYPARAYGNPNSTDILHIPIAISAGLGELGKHGSMISKEYGSNFRLAAVLTDLPLAVDTPVDIGVEDVCATCQRCVIDCPPNAIFPEKQLVRGVEKWYVDFDKCVPYFTKTYGCAICIEVCPWSEPERGAWLSEKMLSRREKEKSGE
jgi:NAD-dependent dihydropyrimidine dehydrogenase PreA subunit